MSNQRKSLCVAFGRYGKLSGLAAVMAAAVLGFGNGASGQLAPPTLDMGPALHDNGGGTRGEAGADRGIRLLTLAPIPGTSANTSGGAMYVFDISFVDQSTQTYYLADRSNAVVDVVDAKNGTFTKQIAAHPAFKGFTGNNNTSGPNGVVAAFPWLIELFHGRQTARTLHFIVAWLLVAFVLVHLFQVLVTGLVNNVRSMINGYFVLPEGPIK